MLQCCSMVLQHIKTLNMFYFMSGTTPIKIGKSLIDHTAHNLGFFGGGALEAALNVFEPVFIRVNIKFICPIKTCLGNHEMNLKRSYLISIEMTEINHM